ncbi:transcriptional regulator [Devosia sp. YR412]|uniref:anti-sigma factor family protein n=1 Tax=Devosia sp. YR412 TaxID=1881030 RepID=UPI0008C515BD|nr:anti-sigma factor [Devosia sp. YR412]SEQ33025.1 transcriptional regulator [Devosia sp. YR412]
MTQITRDMLMAYADGHLPESEHAAMDAHLAANPEAAAEVALIQRQSDAIRILFAPAGGEPVPARLRPRRLAAELAHRRNRGWGLAAAAVVLVGLGLGAGWFARPLFEARPASATLIADAVNAHAVYVAENRHAVEVGSDDSEHLSNWLSNRLDTRLGMPNLDAEGFTLVGGRLLPGAPDAGGRAAQLMYENPDKQRVTIYVTAALPDRAAAYEFTSQDGAEAFYWANARITCTVVGTLPEAQMKAVAGAVYSQLTEGDVSTGRPYRG